MNRKKIVQIIEDFRIHALTAIQGFPDEALFGFRPETFLAAALADFIDELPKDD